MCGFPLLKAADTDTDTDKPAPMATDGYGRLRSW
jgi:hypothetical protein